MNTKHLILGCAAAMLAVCGMSSIASAASPGLFAPSPHEVGVGPQLAFTGKDVIAPLALNVDPGTGGGPNDVVAILALGINETVLAPPGGTKIVKQADIETIVAPSAGPKDAKLASNYPTGWAPHPVFPTIDGGGVQCIDIPII